MIPLARKKQLRAKWCTEGEARQWRFSLTAAELRYIRYLDRLAATSEALYKLIHGEVTQNG